MIIERIELMCVGCVCVGGGAVLLITCLRRWVELRISSKSSSKKSDKFWESNLTQQNNYSQNVTFFGLFLFLLELLIIEGGRLRGVSLACIAASPWYFSSMTAWANSTAVSSL